MALKMKLKKSAYEKLDEKIKVEYKENDDGEFVLDLEGAEDTGALKRALAREKQRGDDAEGELETLRDTNRKLEAGKAGDVVKLTKKHEKDIEELTTSHKTQLSQRDSFITTNLRDNLASSIAAKLNPKAPKVFIPHLEKRITVDLTGDEPKVVILGADGKPSKLTASELESEFVANKDFAGMIVGSKASGGAGAQNNKAGGGAPSQSDNGNAAPSLSAMRPDALAARLKANKEAQTQDA